MPIDSSKTRLRILWVKMGGLWPANSGGRLRSFHIINELSKSHEVTVLTTHGPLEMGAGLRENLPLCKRVESFLFAPAKKDSRLFLFSLAASWLSRYPVDVYKHQCPELAMEVKTLLASGDFDLCIADFLTAVPNVPLAGETPVVLFSHNVEYMIWQRLYDNELSWLKRQLLAIEWRKMRRFETRVCNSVAATISVSEEDAAQLREGSPDACITSVPTGVDIEYFSPAPETVKKPDSLVFSGSMDWFPNEEAMLYFIKEVLPLVRAKSPDVTLTIVGRNPSELLRTTAQNHAVEVTGTVSDIRPWLVSAELYIVPLRIGGGTRLKIYEALAMGLPVISSTIGAEGLDLQEGTHIVRADTAQAFAAQILHLLENPGLREQLGKNGRDLVVEKYSWSRIARNFEFQCRAAALQHEPGPSYKEITADFKNIRN
ncbi:MAG: glycosyltransferase family 4 protein [Pseudohongiella sp.]|nr:glycosyltransferase family 4 protein [Pseudohongiella sp.]